MIRTRWLIGRRRWINPTSSPKIEQSPEIKGYHIANRNEAGCPRIVGFINSIILIESMPARIEAVIKARGGSTKYLLGELVYRLVFHLIAFAWRFGGGRAIGTQNLMVSEV